MANRARHERLYNKEDTLRFFRDLDDLLDRQIEIVAIGGTALTLLNLKKETKDFDFFIGGVNYEEFANILEKLSSKYNLDDIDFWEDNKMILHKNGRIIERSMPPDYKRELSLSFKNIIFKSLNPLDIIVTKLDRCSQQDVVDIKSIVSEYHITAQEIETRLYQHLKLYEGSKEAYVSNFKHALDILGLQDKPLQK